MKIEVSVERLGEQVAALLVELVAAALIGNLTFAYITSMAGDTSLSEKKRIYEESSSRTR